GRAPGETPTAEAVLRSPAGLAAGRGTSATAPRAAGADKAGHLRDATRLPPVRPSPTRRRPATPQAPSRRDTSHPARGDGVSPAPAYVYGLRRPHLGLVACGHPDRGFRPPVAGRISYSGRRLPPGQASHPTAGPGPVRPVDLDGADRKTGGAHRRRPTPADGRIGRVCPHAARQRR